MNVPGKFSVLPTSVEIAIIGGGLMGLATALRFLEKFPGTSIALLEKDPAVASQQSTHNSGVLHSGLYYRPGTEKARLCVSGLKQMVSFCLAHGIPHEICGKVVVATRQNEVPRLLSLLERGVANGVENLKLLTPEELKEIEPNAQGLAAIRVPSEGIVDYKKVAQTLEAEIVLKGATVCTSAKVIRMINEGATTRIVTSRGDLTARFVVNCAGLHSDKMVQASGQKRTARILPFRGEYFQLSEKSRHLVRHLIYPVPDPRFPFLGVHFTRMIQGGVECGPNAILAMAREGYRKSDVHLGELADTLGFVGFWRFLAKYPGVTASEVFRSFSRAAFCRSLQELVPAIRLEDLEPGGAGVRAQAVFPSGAFVEDFLFQGHDRILHVVNAPSPAATASLAIGERIVEEMGKHHDKFKQQV